MLKSFFGRLFDFNDDNEVDEAEETAELLYLESFDDEEAPSDDNDDWDDDEDEDWDDSSSDWEA